MFFVACFSCICQISSGLMVLSSAVPILGNPFSMYSAVMLSLLCVSRYTSPLLSHRPFVFLIGFSFLYSLPDGAHVVSAGFLLYFHFAIMFSLFSMLCVVVVVPGLFPAVPRLFFVCIQALF